MFPKEGRSAEVRGRARGGTDQEEAPQVDAARGHQGRESRVRRGVRSFTPSKRLDVDASRRGFGDYGIQAYDGERTISLEDQQDQVARQLVSFLKRVRKRG